MNNRKSTIESIKKIDSRLSSLEPSDPVTKLLKELRERYINFLDIMNCDYDVNIYVTRSKRELEKMREKSLE